MMNDYEANAPRKPGRPATYVFNKPDSELTEAERKRKASIEKRRLRQNRSYHRRKALRAAAERLPDASIPDITKLPFDNERTVPSIHTAASGLNFPLPRPPHTSTTNNNSSLPFSNYKGAPSTFSSSSNAIHANGHATATRPNYRHLNSDLQDLDCETLAMRWNLPKSSVIPELQSKSSTMKLAAPDYGIAELSMVVPDLLADDDNTNGGNIGSHDATDMLVEKALVAAKQACDLRSSIDKERDMMRMMGIKDMVFDNLRTQIINMSLQLHSALQHFMVFPNTFDSKAAIAVAGVENAFVINEMMQEFIGLNFVSTCGKGRFKLNDTVKMFVKEEAAAHDTSLMDTAQIRKTAIARFRKYFRKQLDEWKGENIHKVGWQREKAMLVYDYERDNMQLAIALCGRKSKTSLRDFLAAAITVMRYCVNACERERLLKIALSDEQHNYNNNNNNDPFIDTNWLGGADSTFFSAPENTNGNANNNNNNNNNSNGRDGENEDEENEASENSNNHGRLQDLANKARLQLALAEAYFDQLKVVEAEAALLKALNLMGGDRIDGNSRMDGSFFATAGDADGTSRVVDSVLVLLLLSNVRMARRRVKEARTLCVKALRILAAAGLGRSTFGINAMANLTGIYLEEGQLDKASVVATRLVDTLNNMGYQTMPIFADALGIIGRVSMKKGKYYDAEQQFGSALEIVKLWSKKDWTSLPIHHCADLDIRLLENMATALVNQHKNDTAKLLIDQAAEMSQKRGLKNIINNNLGIIKGEESKLAPRHLY